MLPSRLWYGAVGLVLLCLSVVPVAAAKPLSVYTSILPVRTFVEAVGGERVEVQSLMKPGQSPATFDIGPRALARLKGAAAFFRVGVPFEASWITRLRAAAPQMTVVDLRQGVELRAFGEFADKEGESANEDGNSVSGITRDAERVAKAMPKGRVPAELADPHTWTSPRNAVIMVKHIRDALARVDPEHRAFYERHATAYIERLQNLDRALMKRLKPFQDRRFLVFHPSWGYFADAYGLRQLSIAKGGAMTGPSALDEIIAKARKYGLHTVFVQDQFSQRQARTVADAIGGELISINPLACDYIANLRHVGDVIAEALQ